MKKYLQLGFFVLAAFLFACSGRTGKGGETVTNSDTGVAVIAFREYEHLFGQVKEGEKVGCIFTFENRGTSDLVILA